MSEFMKPANFASMSSDFFAFLRRRIFPVCAVAAFFFCASALHAEPADIGENFPDFSLPGVPASLRGKVVLVDFWASWCGPCQASFPALDRLYKTHRQDGFIVVGISVDEDSAAMKRFLDRHPVSFPVALDKDHKIAAQVQPKTMPTSFVLDRKGVVRFIHNGFYGAETEKALASEIAQLLKSKD